MVAPLLLNKLFLRLMEAIPVEENDPAEAFSQLRLENWFFWGLYFLFMVAGVFLLLWSRRSKTVVYNVDPEMFGHVLRESLERLSLHSHRVGDRLIIAAKLPGNALDGSEEIVAGPAPRTVGVTSRASVAVAGSAELTVEVFPSMCHVSLHWLRTEGNLRGEIENQLARDIEGARTFDNPAATWFLGLTGLLFGLIFLTGMIWVLTAYFPPRR